MKLFQKLLLGPAAIGLLSPIAVNASEANFKDTNDYSQNDIEVSIDSFKPLSSKNPLLAGGEGSNHSDSSDFDADTFSSTTSASFTVNFAAGSIDTGSDVESFSGYDYTLALTTSFTGDDSLDVELEAGNASNLPELDLHSDGDTLRVGSISYTKALGERLTVFFGDGAAGNTLYNTACVYSGVTDALDDCGNLNSAIDKEFGLAAGLSADLGKGFIAAIGIETQNASSTGLFTDESADAFGAQIAYIGDNFGASVTWANIEDTTAGVLDSDQGATQSIAFNGYFTPDLNNFPSVSVGLETNHDDSASLTDANDDTTHYFVGLQWDELGNGSFGAAYGTKTPYVENGNSEGQYEAYYAYDYADGITITPIIYNRENTGSADDSGILVKTTFEF